MPDVRYAHVPTPWKAALGLGSNLPARFYAGLIEQALRSGLPASRRFGVVYSFFGRRGLPKRIVGSALSRFPRKPRPDLDELIASVVDAWGDLAERARFFDGQPPRLDALALERSAGLTVFLFAGAPRPLMVVKIPGEGNVRVDVERSALEEAEPAEVAPRFLGTVGDARVQEAIPGSPLEVGPLRPEDAGSFLWTSAHADLAAGLARLSSMTAKAQTSDELEIPIQKVLADPSVTANTRARVSQAWEAVEGLEVSVLRHGDTSAQNCLFHEGRFSGLVDWEYGKTRGAPGHDVWNAALAFLEHSVGLARWSQDRVLRAFSGAWRESQYYQEVNRAAGAAIVAAGVSQDVVPELEVAFYARRLGRRLMNPTRYPTQPATAAGMLELVCGRS